MGNYKVCVYAICKNEAQFVERWMDSMSEADCVVVLDTGSTDDTAEKLRQRGAQVTVETVSPWRFDTARNRSLDLVPPDMDLCVCTDLDEIFHPGWRAALERAWGPGVSQISYRYTWSFNPDGSEGVVFWSEKAHARPGAGRSRPWGCSWTTTRTPPNPGASTCPCWSCPSGRTRRTTGICTTWAGNICTGAAGTTASPR